MFKDAPLLLPDVYQLLLKPRNLSRDEFLYLSAYCHLTPKNIIDSRGTVNASVSVGLGNSGSDVRRYIKQGSFFIGKRQVKDFKDELQVEDFFDTGLEGLKWVTVRNGKKIMEVILITYDELMYPSDPWFGEEY